VGLARGYLGRPDLTAEQFVERDVDGSGPRRLYRTGDLARFSPDGYLELLGRTDHQVKIRGQRIELAEVERVLEEHPAVRSAAVVLGPEDAMSATLIAYAESAADPSELRGFLADRLPEVMVPSLVMALDELPRGATGKLDRQALPHPGELPSPGTEEFVAPASGAEATLAGIWESVLGIEPVGATDNFFELGGDSILSIRIIAKANEAGLHITPRQFFERPTIAELAALSERGDW
jgi:aryl carrier-like protein